MKLDRYDPAHFFKSKVLKNFFEKHNITVKDISDLDNFKSLPVTDSNLYVKPWNEITAVPLEELFGFFSSSGTTKGLKKIRPIGKEDLEIMEIAYKYAERHFQKPTDVTAIIAPVGPNLMWYNILSHRTIYGGAVMLLGTPPPEEIVSYLYELPFNAGISLPIGWSRLGEFLQTRPQNIRAAIVEKINILFSGGDVLSMNRRKRIENIFKSKLYNNFGMSEIFGPIGWECKFQRGLHFFDDYLYIEIIDPETKEPVKKGDIGVLVLTTLWKKAMPIFRIWTGDFGRFLDTNCECGDAHQLVEIRGRESNVFDLDSDNKLWAIDLDNAILSAPVSSEYRVAIDKNKKKLNIYVEILKSNKDPNDTIKEIKENVQSLIGKYTVEVHPKKIGEIPRDTQKVKLEKWINMT